MTGIMPSGGERQALTGGERGVSRGRGTNVGARWGGMCTGGLLDADAMKRVLKVRGD